MARDGEDPKESPVSERGCALPGVGPGTGSALARPFRPLGEPWQPAVRRYGPVPQLNDR